MQLGFNAQQFEPTMGMDPWPDGWVPVIIATADGKQTSTGGGQLAIVLQAIDGPLKGKQQFLGLNLWHSNPQTVEIANRTLSALTYVTIGANKGTIQFNDTTELCNIPFYALASRQKDDPSRNEFRAFRDIRGNDPKGQPPAQPLQLAGAGPAQHAQVGGGPAPVAPVAPQGFTPPPGPQAPAWGQPPAQAPAAPVAPQQPPAPTWGQPPQQAAQPPAPAWGQPPAQQPQQPPQQAQPPAFAAPTAAPAAPAWAPPTGGAPAAPAWGQR